MRQSNRLIMNYTEFTAQKTLPGNVLPAKVLVEDSNAGYDFYCGLSQNKKWTVESADGRNRVVNIFPDFKTKTRSFTPQT